MSWVEGMLQWSTMVALVCQRLFRSNKVDQNDKSFRCSNCIGKEKVDVDSQRRKTLPGNEIVEKTQVFPLF
jgi:hypothetical protein